MKILHLVGQREDFGGILSVIRSLHQVGPSSRYQHSVWVHKDYIETREPVLDYRNQTVQNPFLTTSIVELISSLPLLKFDGFP